MIKPIFYTVAFLAVQLAVGGTVSFVFSQASSRGIEVSPGFSLLVAAILSSLVTIALFLLCRWSQVSRTYLVSRPWAVVFWAVVAALGSLIPSMLFQEAMPALPASWQQLVDQSAEQMAQIMGERGGYFLVAILVPVTEELVFRGGVLRALLQWKGSHPWAMIAVSALLFAVAHGNPAQMPHAFLIGLLLGWLYRRTGSIVPGVAFHWANNTVAYILFKLYPDPNLEFTDIFGHQTTTILSALLFSLFIFLPALYQLHLRMKRNV